MGVLMGAWMDGRMDEWTLDRLEHGLISDEYLYELIK